MMESIDTLLIMLLCLAAGAFFSGSEIGVVSADRIKLRTAAAKGSRGAALALKMLEKPEWLLSTTLVGTNIAVVTNTTMATALMIDLFGENAGWLAVVIVAPLIWVFGEIVPKSVFQQHSDTLTPKVIFALRAFSYLFWPILIVFSHLSRMLGKLVGGQEDNSPFTLREQIMTMMSMSPGQGDIEPHEQQMIRRLFDFSETTAREVIVPLVDVISIEQQANCGAAIRLASEKAHKRLPVYAERVDHIVGVVNCLDMLGIDEQTPITEFVHPVDYVPGSKGIHDLLLDLRATGKIMSVVVDEFGGAEGIVSIEDIIEEVVEDLQDEFDGHEESTEGVRKLGERDYLVNARIDPDTLERELGISLPDGAYTSLAGFLLDKARVIPATGSSIDYQGVSFTIRRATPQAVQEVRIHW
jgi:CBS domain containing-hemolysin-like protein